MPCAERTTVGSLPAVRLTAPDGAQATITLYGAHLVSWRAADGQERLFMSSRSALDGSRALRGGVPVIFPQFAARGDGMRHGFARVLPWQLAQTGNEDGAAFAVFALTDDDLPAPQRAAWPHAFKLVLKVTVRARELAMTLSVLNTGSAAFPFAAALHTYHAVDALAAVRIAGLQAQPLTLDDKLDQVFLQAPSALTLHSGAGTLALSQRGFVDAVVWNPGAADAAALPDLAADDYRRFVCIEPALLGPQTLAPGASWHGDYRLTVQ